jgi:hypothetical protein
MASGHQPIPFVANVPLVGDHRNTFNATELNGEAFRPLAWRSLLLLSGASAASDTLLQRLNDGDLMLLRASLERLNAGEPTNAA